MILPAIESSAGSPLPSLGGDGDGDGDGTRAPHQLTTPPRSLPPLRTTEGAAATSANNVMAGSSSNRLAGPGVDLVGRELSPGAHAHLSSQQPTSSDGAVRRCKLTSG